MKRCWNFGPNDRPCFADLVQHINQAFTKVQELPPGESDQNFGYLRVHWFGDNRDYIHRVTDHHLY